MMLGDQGEDKENKSRKKMGFRIVRGEERKALDQENWEGKREEERQRIRKQTNI